MKTSAYLPDHLKKGEVVAIIPARGGSKGIPRKNVRSLGGKPLIAWTIESALACPEVDRVLVSTEDPEIASISQEWGASVPFLRPDHLSEDSANLTEVVEHVVSHLEADGIGVGMLVSLLPTSPYRSPALIPEAISSIRTRCIQVMSTVPIASGKRYWVEKDGKKIPLSSPPNMPVYRGHGSLWATECLPKEIRSSQGAEKAAYIQEELQKGDFRWKSRMLPVVLEDRREQVDLDQPDDWALAETFLRGNPYAKTG